MGVQFHHLLVDVLLGMMVIALELVPAFKRLFGSDVPKGNTRQDVLDMRAS